MSTQAMVNMTWQCLQIHAEAVNMLEGLDQAKEDKYFEENPKIIPLFEVDIMQTLTPYIDKDDKGEEVPLDDKTLRELRLQQEASEREMQVSQRVWASTLDELNLADANAEQKTILIAKEMELANKVKMTDLLCQYKDVFAQ